MTEKSSSYLRYLPPVLWEKEPASSTFSLEAMLCIFEKILTGLDDDVVVQHSNHGHDAVEEVIARLHRLFDPRSTPLAFLSWLASWVDLELSASWDESQQRKAISAI